MSGAARARTVLVTLACSLAAIGAARAQPADLAESPPFQLVYDAPAEQCPSAQVFLGAIRARTERARIAAPGETAVTITVEMTASPGGPVIGRLGIREPDGTRQEREVESATCAEVAQALALVVALYLDPDATAAPRPVEPEPALPAPPPARPRDTAPRRAERRPAPAAERAPGVDVGAGVAIGVAGGVGPSAAPVARAFAEATIDGAAIARIMSWARPSARLSIDLGATTADVAAGSQRYVLLAGALRLCPVDVAVVVRGLHVGPCAGVQAGAHRGTSEGVPNAREQDRPWIAPLASAHASLSLARRVSIELEGGVAVPLVRTRFFLGPEVTLFRTPAVAATTSAAVTVWFR